VAGYLGKAGYGVLMVARPGHADAVMKNGLHVCGLADFTVRISAVSDAVKVSAADVLIVTVKAKDTEEALHGVKHMKIGCALSLQNGMRKNDQLIEAFGAERLLGATTMIGGTLLDPGQVQHTLDGITFFGELDGSLSKRVNKIADAFTRGGLKTSVTGDIASVEWTKQALQSPFASLSVITGLPVRRVWGTPALAKLCIHMFRETAAVARASGSNISDHPAWSLFDMKTLEEAPFEIAVEKLLEIGKNAADHGEEAVIPSMLQDVLKEKTTEIEDTVGYVFQEGRRLGLSTPHTEFAYRSIRAIEDNYQDRLFSSNLES
jgi:2-dehydropantoate 2-reductase